MSRTAHDRGDLALARSIAEFAGHHGRGLGPAPEFDPPAGDLVAAAPRAMAARPRALTRPLSDPRHGCRSVRESPRIAELARLHRLFCFAHRPRPLLLRLDRLRRAALDASTRAQDLRRC